MLDQQPTVDDGGAPPVTAASGATIATISSEAANRFLARFDQPTSAPPDVALGAFEEGHTLIGAATLSRTRDDNATLVVIVDQSGRKLKIGSDLLHAAVTEAASAGLRRLIVTFPSDAAAADALVRSSPPLSARRQAAGTVTTALFLPPTR